MVSFFEMTPFQYTEPLLLLIVIKTSFKVKNWIINFHNFIDTWKQ